ncbi:hypothetical protein JCM17960_22710 [Magnetospira thiophila]
MPAVKKAAVLVPPTPANQVEEAVAVSKETVEVVVKAGTDVAAKSYEKAVAMTKEGVDNASKMQGEAVKGYEDMMTFGQAQLQAWIVASNIFVKGSQQVAQECMKMAQTAMDGNLANTKALFACKDVKELVDLQASVTRSSYESLLADSRKLAEMSVRVTEQAFAPLAERANATLAAFGKPFGA